VEPPYRLVMIHVCVFLFFLCIANVVIRYPDVV